MVDAMASCNWKTIKLFNTVNLNASYEIQLIININIGSTNVTMQYIYQCKIIINRDWGERKEVRTLYFLPNFPVNMELALKK